MAAVLNASYPKGWRLKVSYFHGMFGYKAFAEIQRFDGVYWYKLGGKSIAGEWAAERDDAFKSILSTWAAKKLWTETIRNVTLPWPPAASTEELCLKLSMLES